MAYGSADPYQTLSVTSSASDAEVRAAYRRLVQLHHPDHNGGSADSARRFEEVQEAYAAIRAMRQNPGTAKRPGARPTRPPAAGPTGPPPGEVDPKVESRLADLERELNAARTAARVARERARRAAREAVRAQTSEQPPDATSKRPSDEELGYIETDDSFSKILADAASEIGGRLSEAREHDVAQHVPKRVSELIDELASKLTGEPPTR